MAQGLVRPPENESGTRRRLALVAWLGWGAVLLHPSSPLRYLALSLTACAGVAVSGARRPHVRAWNFVVLGLLAVLMLPLLEGLLLNRPLGPVRIDNFTEVFRFDRAFLLVTLFVVVSNYLPTRLGPAAFLGGLGCGVELFLLEYSQESSALIGTVSRLPLVAVPWVGLICWNGRSFVGLKEPFRSWPGKPHGFAQFDSVLAEFSRSLRTGVELALARTVQSRRTKCRPCRGSWLERSGPRTNVRLDRRSSGRAVDDA